MPRFSASLGRLLGASGVLGRCSLFILAPPERRHVVARSTGRRGPHRKESQSGAILSIERSAPPPPRHSQGNAFFVADASSGLYNLRLPSGVCPAYSSCRIIFNDLYMTFTIGPSWVCAAPADLNQGFCRGVGSASPTDRREGRPQIWQHAASQGLDLAPLRVRFADPPATDRPDDRLTIDDP